MVKNSSKLHIPLHLLQVYCKLFVSRTSDFALQQADGSYRRAGRPLQLLDINRHLQRFHTLGMYVQDEQGKVRFSVFDDDRQNGFAEMQRLRNQLKRDGIPAYMEQSRRGAHLWVFWKEPIYASQARDVLLPYCPDGVEFYPKQNEGCGYGSLIRMPLGVHQLSGMSYAFQDDQAEIISPSVYDVLQQLHLLFQFQRVAVPESRRCSLVALQFDKRLCSTRNQTKSLASSTATTLGPYTDIRSWCNAQNPFEVIGRYVRLNDQGIGRCPFHEHHKHADRKPSFKVYKPKKEGGSCWYCYTWQQGGNVFDFLCHWYGLSAREMWKRIQEGYNHERN
ncbi:CHC2-type zinc finger protein [Thermosporothrix hazakensis]|jgi:hypothetical protein|uniref:CHC2-type zinc finger protein n=1 Tax=Thermosporothrix hazakensis TaxID=644383 RepID=A0A326U0I3_THEHA|nr:CHC2 zinc finger domain-containing protein [Thermosporothrix hazakensis]PZW23897.1 CHC2-type zinc finger protein [Thermosporothrix hazakensis]